MRRLAITAAVAALALAGCSRQGPTPPEEITADDNYVEPAPVAPPVEAPPPPPLNDIDANAVEELPPEPIDPSEQTLEDADATGLTTRALPDAEDEDAPADDEATNEGARE